jgi:hypothetical protein
MRVRMHHPSAYVTGWETRFRRPISGLSNIVMLPIPTPRHRALGHGGLAQLGAEACCWRRNGVLEMHRCLYLFSLLLRDPRPPSWNSIDPPATPHSWIIAYLKRSCIVEMMSSAAGKCVSKTQGPRHSVFIIAAHTCIPSYYGQDMLGCGTYIEQAGGQ